jgi:hypothetical protein
LADNKWALYLSQEHSLSKKEFSGIFSVDELRDYFDEIHFRLRTNDWHSIGLGRKADVIGLDGTPPKW